MFFGKGSSVLIPGFDSFLLRDANSTVSRLKWGAVTVLPMNLCGSWRTPPGTWQTKPQRTSAGRLKWWIIDRFHENLTPSTCSVKLYCSGSFFVHYSVMQNNVSKEDFIWQAQLVKCSFSLSVFSPHLGPEKTMRTTSQTTKICGFLAMGH